MCCLSCFLGVFFFALPLGYVLGLLLFLGIIYTVINVLLVSLFCSVKVTSVENITLGMVSVGIRMHQRDSTHLLDVLSIFTRKTNCVTSCLLSLYIISLL